MREVVFIFLLLLSVACSLLGDGDGESDIPGKIVFSADDSAGNSQIFSMRADGTELRQLTFFEDNAAFQPSWSPDGEHILFSSFKLATSVGPTLWIMAADGSNQRVLHDPEPENPHVFPLPGNNARWSPDGSRVVFDLCTNCQVGTNHELFLYEFATDSVIQLTDTDPPVSNLHPTWSPDGQRIAFTTNRDYVNADTMRFRKDLYMVNVDGTGLQRLTETGNATRPNWSPNEDNIAFEWNIMENTVFIYQLSSDKILKVVSGLEFTGNPLWNNNGDRLLIFGRETEQSQPEARLLEVQEESIQVLFTISLQDQAIGRDYDWFIPKDN